MFINVCPDCGIWKTEKEVRINGRRGTVICKNCGGESRYEALPLFIVLGASGTGKSTISRFLQASQKDFLVLDSDLLWRQEFNSEGTATYFSMWMNLALNLCQCGKPVILFTGGMPEDFVHSPDAVFFPAVHVLGLTASEDDLRSRLRARPEWRGSGTDEFIARMIAYNREVGEAGEALMTTGKRASESAADVLSWAKKHLSTEKL